jgi:hypothetical protein
VVALVWWVWPIVVVGGVLIVWGVAYGVGRWIWRPKPSPIGPGGTIDLRGGAGRSQIPAGAPAVKITGVPIASPLGRTGVTVTVTTYSAIGQVVADIPIDVAVEVGTDSVQTSMLDFGPDPNGVGRLVGTRALAVTDNVGLLSFVVRSTRPGDDDDLSIVVDPPRRGEQGPWHYSTR